MDVARTREQRRELQELVAASVVIQLGRGWVARADVEHALMLARRLDASITCVSAAPYYRLATLDTPPVIHLAVPYDRNNQLVVPGLPRPRVHRETGWTSPTGGRIPLAPVADALARVLRCQPQLAAVTMVDSALNQGLVTVEELERSLRGPGRTAGLAALARCDGRSRSATETKARLTLVDAGFTVCAGVIISGVGEVDLLVDGVVVVECDGFAYHSRRRQFAEDRRRDRELLARGYVVLRFTWHEVMNQPELVVAEVRKVLSSGAAGHVRPGLARAQR
ncbi:endonuclease domain-containing protein [Georgenia sp. TF02-10]|uniref:endonuclease domain-containing protein n=1 Tax=Georgenia sp. TF02-10 TaxID=2917725 RepID=UPI001FA7FBEB|nr:DUF559 domain-containing protein [Georgenia sp. TF02-10]UNX55413.1 endonuclease domain-containing protein [Georgenia sp. TF02-10]